MPTAYRTQQITIDVVKPNTTPMISLLVQRLELDDEKAIQAITGHSDRIYRNGLTVMQETVSFTDPVTGLAGEISIAGMQRILTTWANRWISEDLGCEVDPETGWATNCTLM